MATRIVKINSNQQKREGNNKEGDEHILHPIPSHFYINSYVIITKIIWSSRRRRKIVLFNVRLTDFDRTPGEETAAVEAMRRGGAHGRKSGSLVHALQQHGGAASAADPLPDGRVRR